VDHPRVRAAIRARGVSLDETVISPAAIFESNLLVAEFQR
jgi:hypothetical protein